MSAAVKPTVVCLCGSTRWPQAFDLANMHESLMGRVVISLGCFGHADQPTGARFLTSDGDESTPEKAALDQLHFRKIDLADEILVINVGGYVGSSTRREIAYAREQGKRVRWLFPGAVPADLATEEMLDWIEDDEAAPTTPGEAYKAFDCVACGAPEDAPPAGPCIGHGTPAAHLPAEPDWNHAADLPSPGEGTRA